MKLYKAIYAPGENFFTRNGTPPELVEIPVPPELICDGCHQMAALAGMLTDGLCKQCREEK